MNEPSSLAVNSSEQLFSKVPEITVYFWILKLFTTAMGESTSDYLVSHINPYIAVVLGAIGFFVAFLLQFITKRYAAPVYWLLVVMVSIFGTMVADVTHIVLGVPYYLSTATFAIALAVILISWFKTEGTLSIHSIYTKRREMFYWATVLATFALGTAAGDMTATTLHLGYLTSGLLFGAVFIMSGASYFILRLNPIFTFWFAYIFTRPLGASFADWLGKPVSIHGMGYGDGVVSLTLTTLILILVTYLTVSRSDIISNRFTPQYETEFEES